MSTFWKTVNFLKFIYSHFWIAHLPQRGTLMCFTHTWQTCFYILILKKYRPIMCDSPEYAICHLPSGGVFLLTVSCGLSEAALDHMRPLFFFFPFFLVGFVKCCDFWKLPASCMIFTPSRGCARAWPSHATSGHSPILMQLPRPQKIAWEQRVLLGIVVGCWWTLVCYAKHVMFDMYSIGSVSPYYSY